MLQTSPNKTTMPQKPRKQGSAAFDRILEKAQPFIRAVIHRDNHSSGQPFTKAAIYQDRHSPSTVRRMISSISW